MKKKYPYLVDGLYLYNNPNQPYIFSFDQREALTLNHSASFILDKCDGKTSVQDIIQKVVKDFAISYERAQKDVEYTLRYAHSEGIITYTVNPLPEKRVQSLGSVNSFVPIEAFVQITYRCNFRCEYCFLGPPQNKDLGNVSEVFDRLFEWGTRKVVLTGGEPMVRNDFITVLKEATQKFYQVDVQTNGYFIKNLAADILSLPTRTGFYISLDGPEEYTDTLHGKGTYSRIIEGITFLQQNGYRIRLSILLNPDNITYYQHLKDLAEKLVGDKVSFGIALPIGKSSQKIKEMYNDREFVFNYLRKMGRESLKAHNNSAFEGSSANPAVNQCGAGVTTVTITPEGNIYPCATVCTDKRWAMGNIFTDQLQKISQRISPVYANRPEQKCEKSTGYALDVFGPDFGGCFSIASELCRKGDTFNPPEI